MQSHKFLVSGRVQGVYYCANVAKNAQKAGFSGYVKNLDDGRVEACVSCLDEDLERFKKILQEGSPISKVTQIEERACLEVFSDHFVVRK